MYANRYHFVPPQKVHQEICFHQKIREPALPTNSIEILLLTSASDPTATAIGSSSLSCDSSTKPEIQKEPERLESKNYYCIAQQ